MTNKFISMMDGIRQGIASVLTPRCHRSDSLSIVSRQSLLPIFLLCLTLFIGVGQMWGADATSNFSNSSLAVGTGEPTWATTVNATGFESASYARGVTWGSGGDPVLTSSTITGTITKVTVVASTNAGASKVSLSVSVGSTSFSPASTYVTSGTSDCNSPYEFTGSATGTVTVSLTNSNNSKTAWIKSITITYSSGSSKTLSSISVQTAPSKKKYVAGEMFDPTGLVITRNYSDATSDTYTYANHTSDFTFSPTTSTALTTSNTSVSITYGGKSTSQAINVYNVTMQARDEDGNTIPSGGPEAPSRTGKSISPANDANNYVFKQWQVTNASLGSGESTKSNTITNPTGAVTVTAVYYKPITVTYKANGQNFTTQTYGHGGTLAFPVSGPSGDTYSCTGKTFTGWVAEANKDYSHATTAPTYATAGGSVTAAATYYAVFANASGNKTTKTDNITRTTTGVTANSTNYSAWSGKTLTSSATYAGQSAGGNSAIQLRNQSPSGVISTASGGTLKKITITWNSNTTAGRYVTIFGKATAYSQTSDLYNNSYKGTELGTIIKGTSTELNVTGTYNYVGILASAAIYVENIAVQWEVDNVTYTNFETNCCTPLGSINGSVSCTNGTSATLTWGDVTGAESYKVKVPGSSNCNDWITATSPFSVTGLTAGQNYTAYFKAFDSNGSHCTEGPESTTAFTTPQITVTGTPLAEMTYAQGDGPSSAESFVVKGKGLCGANSGQLTVTAPTNFEVSLDNSSWGDSKTITKANAESNSGQTVYVRLKKDLLLANSPFGPSNVVISGGNAASVNVSVSGTVTSACSVPTVATPTCTSVAEGTITVSCAYITVGQNCDVDEYGFVWKASSEPSISDNKTPNAGAYAANFSKALTIDGFATGTTYNIKAYGHNAADYALSANLAVTPRKVTFSKNGHGTQSVPATQYMVDGGKASEPSALTDPNYTFGGWWTKADWQAEGAAQWNFTSNTVTDGDKTLYAKWTPKDYTITVSGLTNVEPTSAFPSSFVYTGETTTALNRTLAVNTTNFFLPDNLTVTMGGSTLTQGTHYTYSNSTGAFAFNVIITGDIVISGTAVAKLKGITISNQPTKLAYLVGQTFDKTGATVTATMGDGSSKAVTASAVWTPAGALSAGEDQTITATYTERGIDQTATTTVDVYSVTVTTVDAANDNVIDVDGVEASCSIAALSYNTGSTNYKFKEWYLQTASGMTISNNALTGTPSGNVVVYARFYKPISIAWKVGTGNAPAGEQTLQVQYGTQMKDLTLPSNPADNALASCGTNKFMGWSANEVKGTGQSAPADLFTAASGETAITSDKTFYAVFANASNSGSADDYVLVESELSDWSGTYVMVDYGGSNYAMSSDVTSGKFGAVSVSPTNKVINCTNDKLIWTITKGTGDNASKYSVKSKKTNTYANSGSTSTSASLSNSAVYLTVTYTSSYGIRIKGSSRWFSYYSSDFRTYSGASDNGFALYKKNEVTYSDYQTSCCTTLDAVSNVSVTPGRTSATVSWDKLTNASGYEYKLGDAEWATASVADANNPSISLSTLSGATSYAIQIRATGDGTTYCDKGTASAVTNFKTFSRVTAAVNDDARGTAQVSLNGEDWAASVDAADGTTIYLQATPSSVSWILGSWGASNGDVASNQLTGWTDDVTVTANFAAAELPTLATPTGMSSSAVTAISATISWNAVANASSYAISCTPSATQGDVTESAGICSCTLTGLSAGTAYTWNVQAVGDNISYKSGTACEDQNFTTVAKQPTAIAVTTAPSKTSYLEGESFDATGMVVRVTYNTEEVDDNATNYTVTPAGALELGTTSVTITVNGSAISTTQAITVVKKYTLTLKNNGVQVGEVRDLYEGAVYGALPELTAGDACDATSTTFMGWTTESILEKRAAAPVSYASATDVMGAADVVLNAVWSKMSGAGADVDDIMWSENWTGATTATTNDGTANPSVYGKTGTTVYGGGTVTYTENSNDVYCRADSYAGGSSPELYIKSGGSWTISGIPTGNAATLTLTIATNATSFQTLSVSTAEDGKNPTISGSISGHTGTYTITTDGASTLQLVFGNNSNTRIDNIVLKVATTNVSYADYLTSCCTEWSAPEISYSTPAHWKAGDGDVAVTIAVGSTYGAVSFESSDEDVLTVDAETGAITAVAPGTATVTATWAGGVVDAVRYCTASSEVEVAVSGTVTVSFDGNGATNGSMANQVMYYNESTALSANAFSKTGYTFYGWAETEQKADAGDRDYAGGASVTFTTDKTLYAAWTINKHAVTLNQPTGNTIEATGAANLASVAYGTEITLSATENDGYVFTGWSVTGATVADASEKSTTFSMPDNDVTVTATYSTYEWIAADPRYTVTTAPKIEYYKVEKFSTAGVVIKENFKRSDDNNITKQETYAGAWTAKLNGVTIANGADLSLEDNGKTLKLYIGEVEIASYTLIVNNIDVDQFVVGIWDIEAPSFQINTYTMPTLSNQTAGEAATCHDHNLFVGWTTDPDDPKDANIIAGGTAGVVASNTTYYAVWAKTGTVTRTLSYGWEDGESSTGLDITMTTSSIEGGARTGSKFASAASGKVVKTSNSYASPKSITYYIQKQTTNKNENNYFVLQYSANGSTWTDIDETKRTLEDLSQTAWTEISLNLSAETYHNKYFQVYYKTGGAAGSLDDFSFSYETTGPTDYITDCETRHTIKFYADQTLENKVAEKKYKEGAVIEMPDKYIGMSKEYHTFAGWRSAAEFTESIDKVYAVGEEYTVTRYDFIYGEWTPFSQGAITIDGETLEGSPFYATQSYTLPTPDAISGKKFIGWSDGEHIVAPGEYVMPDPAVNINYTSQWFDLLPKPSGVSFTDGEWILVTAQDQLHAGDFIVVAAANADYAMGAEASGGNNRTPQAVTKSGNTLSYESDVVPLFLQNGYGANQYALYDMSAEKYLYAASSGNNYLKIDNDFDENGSWLITIANGSTSVIAQGTNTHNDLRYNAGNSVANSVFSCYLEGGQQPIALYRWIETIKTEGNVNASDVVPTYNVNLVVQTNTSIDMDVARTVNDFYIEAMEGQSGQIKNPENLNINGNAYYDLTLNTSGTMDNSKWYAFAVPFQVDAATGIQRLSNDGKTSNAGFNSHYVLLKFNSAMYAENNTNGWEYVTRGETLMPGKFYMIALNSNEYNRVRMTKKAGTPLNNKADLTLSTVGTGAHANWNAIANNALAYANVSATGTNAGENMKVQVYNSAANSYTALGFSEVTFTVGTPFFFQAAEAGTMSVNITGSNNEFVKAPAREAVATGEFQIRLGANTESYYDILYVSASDEALNEYQIGHDLAKAGISTTVPQLYIPAYGAKLCDAEFPLVNNEATFPLTFTAPNAGTYQLYIAKAASDAELYLQKDGATIWNLTMGAYPLELPQGTTENYGLLLKAKAPGSATGIENGGMLNGANGVQKVIIDENVFILRGGQIYDVTGKAVR